MIDDASGRSTSPVRSQLPRSHPFAPPHKIRGYCSEHVIDETSLRRPLSSFHETFRREVLDQNVVSPTLFKALDLLPSHQNTNASRQSHEVNTISSPLLTKMTPPCSTFKLLPLKLHAVCKRWMKPQLLLRKLSTYNLSMLLHVNRSQC